MARRRDPAAQAPPGPLSLQDFLPYRISVLAELVSGVFARSYEARFGLSIPEWRVMAVLGEGPAQSTQAVIERTAMDRVRVSRAAIRLADKGLIERRPQPGDQRAHVLELTPRGAEVYGRIVPLAREMQAILAGSLTASERAQFDAILDKLGAQARAMAAAASA